jgi:hypothetical protein
MPRLRARGGAGSVTATVADLESPPECGSAWAAAGAGSRHRPAIRSVKVCYHGDFEPTRHRQMRAEARRCSK